MYCERDLVRIAKRENNRKRNYLVADPLQGKHIPVSPGKALELFDTLAGLLEEYRGERLLVAGFAETATAIGAQIAIALGADYIQTTREAVEGASYLLFSEEHSHAVEQKLVKESMDRMLGGIDRIIFAEDEITTGKTILNIISVLERQYGGRVKYSVASLLNGMSEESLAVYAERGIGVHFLVKIHNERYPAMAEEMENNGIYHLPDTAPGEYTARFDIGGRIDTRRGTGAAEYAAACGRLFTEIMGNIFPGKLFPGNISNDKISFLKIPHGDVPGGDVPHGERERILVLGTEEFMYPGLYVGKCLEDAGYFVRFHATTRSPILVSADSGYPLRERYELDSLYEEGRRTFVYDIDSYDIVIVITDAPGDDLGEALVEARTDDLGEALVEARADDQGDVSWDALRAGKKGETALLNALRRKNERVYLVRWRDSCGREGLR